MYRVQRLYYFEIVMLTVSTIDYFTNINNYSTVITFSLSGGQILIRYKEIGLTLEMGQLEPQIIWNGLIQDSLLIL